MQDIYKNFKHLSESLIQDKDYTIEYYKHPTSKILILTPHGGGIEPGTTELIKEIAATDMSWYSFSGIMSTNNDKLHVTSTNFDEPICLQMLSNSTTTLTIHGCNDDTPTIYVGGLDSKLSDSIYQNLSKLTQFNTIHCNQYQTTFPGTSKLNITNKNAILAGTQIELSSKLRSMMFQDATKRKGRLQKTPLFWSITATIRDAIYPNAFNEM